MQNVRMHWTITRRKNKLLLRQTMEKSPIITRIFLYKNVFPPHITKTLHFTIFITSGLSTLHNLMSIKLLKILINNSFCQYFAIGTVLKLPEHCISFSLYPTSLDRFPVACISPCLRHFPHYFPAITVSPVHNFKSGLVSSVLGESYLQQ